MADAADDWIEQRNKSLAGKRITLCIELPTSVIDHLAEYAKHNNYQPETILAEALRAYLGDAS